MKRLLSLVLCLCMLAGTCITVSGAYSTPYEDSEFFEYEGYSIHYRRWEAESPRGQIFMIHGFAHNTYCWENMARVLVENGYTCVMADLPDFGYSSRETVEMKKLPREEIMHALMCSLSDERWYVAGHSMGGFVAESIYAAYPESVNNLLLYGTSGNFSNPSMAALAVNKCLIAVMKPILKLMLRWDFIIELFLRSCFQDNSFAKDYDYSKVAEPLRIDGTVEGAFCSFSMLSDTDYAAIKQGPAVLYINGSADTVISESAVEELLANLPEDSSYHIIEGAGHLFIENRWEQASQLTLEFLEENPA